MMMLRLTPLLAALAFLAMLTPPVWADCSTGKGAPAYLCADTAKLRCSQTPAASVQFPNATKNLTPCATASVATTDIGSVACSPGNIVLTDGTGKIDPGCLPASTATTTLTATVTNTVYLLDGLKSIVTATASTTSAGTGTGTGTSSGSASATVTDTATASGGTGTATAAVNICTGTHTAFLTETLTVTATATLASTATKTIVVTGTATATGTGSGTGTTSGTVTKTFTTTGSATATTTASTRDVGTSTCTGFQTLTLTSLGTSTATGSVTVSVTSTGTTSASGTASGTWTGTSTSTGTSTLLKVGDNPTLGYTATATSTYTIVMPNATKTFTGTVTVTQTDLGTTATGTGIIPVTQSNAKLNSGVIPWDGIVGSGLASTSNGSYDVGTSSNKWKDGYFSGTVHATDVTVPHIVTIDSHYFSGTVTAANTCVTVASAGCTTTTNASYVAISASASVVQTSGSSGLCLIEVWREDSTVLPWSVSGATLNSTVPRQASLSVSGADFPSVAAHTWTLKLCSVDAAITCKIDTTALMSGSITIMQWGY